MSSSYSLVWWEVDSVVPVHRYLNHFIQLENHQGVLQVTAFTHTDTHACNERKLCITVATNRDNNYSMRHILTRRYGEHVA